MSIDTFEQWQEQAEAYKCLQVGRNGERAFYMMQGFKIQEETVFPGGFGGECSHHFEIWLPRLTNADTRTKLAGKYHGQWHENYYADLDPGAPPHCGFLQFFREEGDHDLWDYLKAVTAMFPHTLNELNTPVDHKEAADA